ncbi:antibiotic biosynthesis monooxygenase [Kitasatospora sp. NPDC096147]|uniref:antibiotic biosynthesis monooxygenase n=1 Tax=Kitasatospora sp. NPDC096147 TaxID=3364093 RepID=UPI003802A54D
MTTTVRENSDRITLYITEQVDAGHEEEFKAWARGILEAAAAHPGSAGTGLLPPSGEGEPWRLLLHFEDAAAFRSWHESPVRAACLAKGRADGYHRMVGRQELLGVDGWFAATAGPAPAGEAPKGPPGRWKMWIVSTLAIAPITSVVNLFLVPHLSALPVLARTVLMAPVICFLMVYVAIPLVTKGLRRWIFPD